MQIFPVFIPLKGCPFKCVYCDQSSFGSVEETPFELLSEQIRAFCLKNHTTQKQIAFYGGTFTGLSITEREKYYRLAEPFLDGKTSLRISTRPDLVSEEQLDWCQSHGVTTIELGIQDLDDEVLKASQRGYDSQTALDACLRVKARGFELGVQLLPGLPGFSPASFLLATRRMRGDIVDILRVYPLVILRGTALWEKWENGEIIPLTLEEAIGICADWCDWADANDVQVIKIGIPSLAKGVEYAGPYHPALGELVRGERIIRKIERGYQPGMSVRISAGEISLLTGHKGYNLRKLLQRTGEKQVKLVPDESLPKGEISLNAD
jgi:histone acetyltransferase (RNA polymerase elongator complex component)